MTKSEAYAIVLQDLQKCSLFTGLYDAKNGSRIFMNGISNVMELIAYGVSEEVGDAFADLFIDNMVKCEKEAQNKRANTPTEASAESEWIPVSERLPEESGTYLTTTAKGSVCTDHFYANSNDICGRHWSYHRRREPIAWKPLPKPYREDGE